MLNRLRSLMVFVRYSAGHLFAGKFVYFLLLATVLFLAVVLIYTLNESTPPGPAAVYFFLLAPGALLVFYPSAYTVQSDADARMLETLFGIPDYRFKIWLVRHLVQQLAVALLLLLLALLCNLALADFSVPLMVFHLMFPLFFLSSLGFGVATLTRSGNGTAAVLVVLALFSLVLYEPLRDISWYLCYNPFRQADAATALLRDETTLYNRIYLLVGAILAILFGLLRLQQREKFV